MPGRTAAPFRQSACSDLVAVMAADAWFVQNPVPPAAVLQMVGFGKPEAVKCGCKEKCGASCATLVPERIKTAILNPEIRFFPIVCLFLQIWKSLMSMMNLQAA